MLNNWDRSMKPSLAALAIMASFGSPAAAQPADPEGRQKALEECVRLQSDAARLACFDAVMTGDGEPDEEVLAVQEKESRENFGLSEAQVREKRGDPEPELQVTLQSTVSATRKEASGAMTFALSNGQIWRTTNASNMRYELKPGDQVSLRKGMLGGFRLEVDGRRGFLGVERIR